MQFPGVAGNPGDWYIKTIPETIDVVWMKKLKEIGIPTPNQTLNLETPQWSKKKTFEEGKFEYKYPEGERVTAEKLGLTPEECLKGVYLDINHETPLDEAITPEKVLAVGLGRDTELKK